MLLSAAAALPCRAAAQPPGWLSVLKPAGPQAEAIADIAWVLFIGGTLIFVGVMVLLALSLRRGARPVNTWRWVVGGGVVFPVVTLSALLVFNGVRSAELTRPPPGDALVVSVIGRMWWWEVQYRDPASGRSFTTANEIRVPAGRPVRLALETADVIHSAWLPSLNGKMDLVPGRVNHLVFTAERPGLYLGKCAEYCGQQHAHMALHVVAETPEAFEAWFARQAQPAAPAADPVLAAGRRAFLEHRCNACHTVRGVAEESRLGPDLTHVGSRLYIGAGLLPTHPGTLAGWIAGVQELKPGARMPSFGQIDPQTLQALSAWLAQLK
ncbi:cytochrome c oxidase subunit II [Caldimonas tepidiphila]|uniref:cytochrome c oxidase subunit II n=1 Tax=Caldimonas tepidiphila TaxID=2315841 RepID=UPI003012C116